jgi:hypothetical protein
VRKFVNQDKKSFIKLVLEVQLETGKALGSIIKVFLQSYFTTFHHKLTRLALKKKIMSLVKNSLWPAL